MAKPAKDYKSLEAELEVILADLQNPDTDIDKALILYQRGQAILKELEQYLKRAENTVRQLTSKPKA